eukprot:1856980-Pyramimonas_sp.AAC.1
MLASVARIGDGSLPECWNRLGHSQYCTCDLKRRGGGAAVARGGRVHQEAEQPQAAAGLLS